jgi:hypothetical protein
MEKGQKSYDNWFCKSFPHVTVITLSPYIPDNVEFYCISYAAILITVKVWLCSAIQDKGL